MTTKRSILKILLAVLAKRTISRYEPEVIGITGSVGKSSTKEAVFEIVKCKFRSRKNEENFNNEIGVPNAILGTSFTGNAASKLFNLFKAFWIALGFKNDMYPEVLVLELAADRPGDIGYLVNIVKPEIGVITAIGQVPVHSEFYDSPVSVAKEKAKLLHSLPNNGLAVIYHDDPVSYDLRHNIKCPVITFGLNKKSDFWSSDVNYYLSDDNQKDQIQRRNIIGGLTFKINHQLSFIPAKLNGVIAPHLINSILAATAVGQHLGINLVDISQSIERIIFPKHRMTLIKGVKNSFIIDDTYNSSPLAAQAAIGVLFSFGGAIKKINGKGRKIAILGDMKELGKFEVPAHKEIGDLASDKVDYLITVGVAAKFISDSASIQLAKENILHFSSSEEAKTKIRDIIEEGDIVLIKGSRSMKMESIVEELVDVN